MDIIRNDTAKRYREIRRLLRGTEPIQSPDEIQESPRHIFSAFVLSVCMVFALLIILVCGFGGCARAYTVDELATAIGKAENSKSHPYGIMAHYRHTTPRQACINTIRHYLRDWRKSTQETGLEQPFLEYIARHYAPIGANNDPQGLNRYWIKNVSYFLGRG